METHGDQLNIGNMEGLNPYYNGRYSWSLILRS